MRGILLGILIGTVISIPATFAAIHYLADNAPPPQIPPQAGSTPAPAIVTTAGNNDDQLKSEIDALSDQNKQLIARNEDLQAQLDALKKAPASTTAPPMNVMALAGIMRGMMRGAMQGQQRMVLLQNRLHLTPDQAAAIKAAMDADGKARRDMMQQMFRNNGKVDPQAAAQANTLDQTLDSVLTPEQKTAYQQVQADEQTSRADMMATMQVDQVMPLLQLNDSQKDQVYNAIYQAQMSAPDPMTLMGNPNAASIISAQAQATQDALAKVLTPDQMTLYQQQAQSAFGGFGPRGNGGNAPGAAPNSSSTTGATTTGYVSTPGSTTPTLATTTNVTLYPPGTSDSGSNNVTPTPAPSPAATPTPAATTSPTPAQ